MVERQEVEALLEHVNLCLATDIGLTPTVSDETLAALCRAWLAAEDARKVCEEVSSLLEKLETTYTCDSIIIDKCWRLLEEVTGD